MSIATPLLAGSAALPSFATSGCGPVSPLVAFVRFTSTAAARSSTVCREEGASCEGGTFAEVLSTEKDGVSSSMSVCARVPSSQLCKQDVSQHEINDEYDEKLDGMYGSSENERGDELRSAALRGIPRAMSPDYSETKQRVGPGV